MIGSLDAPFAAGVAEKLFAQTIAGLRAVSIADLETATEVLRAARRHGRRVYVFGNGGSAATASHLVCDLIRRPEPSSGATLRAFALVDNVAVLTAQANDVCYEDTFACQVATHGEPGDIAIAISASGRSPNVLAALRLARRSKLYCVGLLGSGGGPAAELVDLPLIVESVDFGVIETVHLAIVHVLAASLGEPYASSRPRPAS